MAAPHHLGFDDWSYRICQLQKPYSRTKHEVNQTTSCININTFKFSKVATSRHLELIKCQVAPLDLPTPKIHTTMCLKKNIPDIFDCNLKTNCQILIFGTNISDTTCHQMTIQFPTLPNVCFCTTWEKHNQQNITFLSNATWSLN